MSNDQINNLKEALKFSPNNIPLKLHLAETLANQLLYAEAEQQYKDVLQLEGNNNKAKFGLAHVYFKQDKFSAASVILEELCNINPEKDCLLLYAKVLLKENMNKEAQNMYMKAVDLFPGLRDEELDSVFRQSGSSMPDDDLFDEDALRFMEKPDVNFSHVGGMARVKEEIDLKIILPLKQPDLYKAYGKKTGGGILLYGPPGCGKTHLARATAGQVNAHFISMGINDILDMWIGNSEKNLHEVFEIARRNTPCVLFIDEVDALGANRSDMRQSGSRHLINQFLSELDGINSNNDGILILAATNAPWHLDPAFRRPGRFDRIIFVNPPDKEGREQILKIMLEGKPVSGIQHSDIAKVTDDFSGADLKALVDIAIEDKLKESLQSGKIEPISTKDLIKAAGKHKPSTREWFTTAKNYALYANDSGLYDDILNYLKIKK